ncbi:MAG: Flp family type IVb pilin [Thermoanaerobacterales bacterium]|nr:Flp family type IVb pilin [Thermoanaerobacterales bacterium]
MKELLGRLWKDESGQGMAEYGLILALIAVVVIAAAVSLGTSISDKFSGVAGEISKTRP